MEKLQFLTIVVLHVALIGAGLSAWMEKVPVYRFFALLSALAMALAVSQSSGLAGLAAVLLGLSVVVPVVLGLVSRLIHRVAIQKGIPSQFLTTVGSYRYMWSLQ